MRALGSTSNPAQSGPMDFFAMLLPDRTQSIDRTPDVIMRPISAYEKHLLCSRRSPDRARGLTEGLRSIDLRPKGQMPSVCLLGRLRTQDDGWSSDCSDTMSITVCFNFFLPGFFVNTCLKRSSIFLLRSLLSCPKRSFEIRSPFSNHSIAA